MHTSLQSAWNHAAYNKEFTTPLQLDLLEKYIPKSARILDVGCGYGRSLHELYCNGYLHLQGIDFSEKMIERSKKQYPYLSVDLQTSPDVSFEDYSFDAVILFAVLTCIIENKAQIHLLKEIKRVLKPDGIIYVNDFLLNTDQRNLDRYRSFKEKYPTYGVFELPDGLVLRHHSLEWVHTCLASFQALHFEILSFPTMNGNKSNGYCFIGKNLSGIA